MGLLVSSSRAGFASVFSSTGERLRMSVNVPSATVVKVWGRPASS